MKKIIPAAVLVAIIAVLFVPHIYVQFEFPGPAQVLWNDQHGFVFLQKNQQGWSVTPIQYLKSALLSAAGGYDPFTDSRADVTVLEINRGKVRSYLVPNFDVLSGVFPYKGALYVMYYENGKAEMPKNYRWTGESFDPILVEEAQRIRADFQFVSDLITREGWQSQQIVQNTNQRVSIPVTVGGEHYFVEVQSPGNWKNVVTLREPAGERTLAMYDSRARNYLSRNQYESIFGKK